MQITLSFSHCRFGFAFASVCNILSPDGHMAGAFTSLRSLLKRNLLKEAPRSPYLKKDSTPPHDFLPLHRTFHCATLFVFDHHLSPPLEIKLHEGRDFILCPIVPVPDT